MAKAHAAHGDVVELVMRDGYTAFFAYAEQWLDVQKAALAETLGSVEPSEFSWLAGVNGAIGDWTRIYLDALQAMLEQMRRVGEAMAENHVSLLKALESK